jgi:hypothetical protein
MKSQLPPSSLEDAPYRAEPIDVWGIGVILFTMLVGSESPLFILDRSSGYVLDTPWDEPSDNSFEFCAYVNGEIFDKDPWNRLSRRCSVSRLSIFTTSVVLTGARLDNGNVEHQPR